MTKTRDKQGRFLKTNHLGNIPEKEDNSFMWVLIGTAVVGAGYLIVSEGVGLLDFSKSYGLSYDKIAFHIDGNGVSFLVIPVIENPTPTGVILSQLMVFFGINNKEIARSSPRTGSNVIVNIIPNGKTSLGSFLVQISWGTLFPYAPKMILAVGKIISNYEKIKAEFNAAREVINSNMVMSEKEKIFRINEAGKAFAAKFGSIFEKFGLTFQYKTTCYFERMKLGGDWTDLVNT